MYVPQTLDYDFLKNPFSQRKWVFGEENYDIWGAEVFASAPVSASGMQKSLLLHKRQQRLRQQRLTHSQIDSLKCNLLVIV
jgi:hypothetical protein